MSVLDLHRPHWYRRQGSRFVRWGILVGLIVALQLLAMSGHVAEYVLPEPSAAVQRLASIIGASGFLNDLATTVLTTLGAFVLGAGIGVPIGVLFWKVSYLSQVAEPFLVALYSMPLIVFYPVALAILGLGIMPIIILGAVTAGVPIVLAISVGLREIDPVLFKLAASVSAGKVATARKILIPAAVPIIIPGVKVSFMYALNSVVAMEFVLAFKGLGYEAGRAYREFEVVDMYAYIIAVVVLGVACNCLLTYIENRVRTDML